jgi:hypothetical protein
MCAKGGGAQGGGGACGDRRRGKDERSFFSRRRSFSRRLGREPTAHLSSPSSLPSPPTGPGMANDGRSACPDACIGSSTVNDRRSLCFVGVFALGGRSRGRAWPRRRGGPASPRPREQSAAPPRPPNPAQPASWLCRAHCQGFSWGRTGLDWAWAGLPSRKKKAGGSPSNPRRAPDLLLLTHSSPLFSIPSFF